MSIINHYIPRQDIEAKPLAVFGIYFLTKIIITNINILSIVFSKISSNTIEMNKMIWYNFVAKKGEDDEP